MGNTPEQTGRVIRASRFKNSGYVRVNSQRTSCQWVTLLSLTLHAIVMPPTCGTRGLSPHSACCCCCAALR